MTGEVISIARGVDNGSSRQEEDIAFDNSSDLWNNPAGEYAQSSFLFYCYDFFSVVIDCRYSFFCVS